MQVQVVRHDGRPEDADGREERLGIARDARRGHEPARRLDEAGARERELVEEAARDNHDERRDEALEPLRAAPLEREDDADVEAGERDAERDGHAEEERDRERRAEHLGELGRDDRDLRGEPHHDRRARPPLARARSEIAPGRDAEARAHHLEEDREEPRADDHEEERAPEA